MGYFVLCTLHLVVILIEIEIALVWRNKSELLVIEYHASALHSLFVTCKFGDRTTKVHKIE